MMQKSAVKFTRHLCPILMILLFWGGADSAMAALRAGFAKIDITPEKPVVMFGYAARGNTLSEGIHDRLYVRVTAFENRGKELLLISSDLGDFYFGTLEFIRDEILTTYDLDTSECFLTCTHTHSAPTLTVNKEKEFKLFKPKRKDFQPHPNNLEYTEQLRAKMLKAVQMAFEDMNEVDIGAAIGYCPIGMHRRTLNPADGKMWIGRNPYGPADKDVHILTLRSPETRLRGVLFDFAVHGTSLGWKNLKISGDVLGLASGFVENYFKQGVVAPVFAGASGDINPWFVKVDTFITHNGWIPEPELLGMMLGEEVIRTMKNVENLKDDAEIKTAYTALQLPTQKEMRGQELLLDTIPLNITAASVGDVAFIGFGTEMMTEIGMEIKEASPFEYTFLLTHCNGASGYLAPEHAFAEGGYEIFSSPFTADAADMVVKQALKMLYQLY